MTAAAKEGMEAGNRAKWQRWVPWIALAIFVLDALGYGWFRHSQCYSSLRKGLINRATRYFFFKEGGSHVPYQQTNDEKASNGANKEPKPSQPGGHSPYSQRQYHRNEIRCGIYRFDLLDGFILIEPRSSFIFSGPLLV